MAKTNAAERQAERQDAIAKLREQLPVGSKVYVVCRHVSRSGMSRCLSFFAVLGGELVCLDYNVRRALDLRFNRGHGGLVVDGCGMDMGFHTVHNLSYAVHGYPSDYAQCPDCGGRGKLPERTCERCDGRGRYEKPERGCRLLECFACMHGKIEPRCERCDGHGTLYGVSWIGTGLAGKPAHPGYTLTHEWL